MRNVPFFRPLFPPPFSAPFFRPLFPPFPTVGDKKGGGDKKGTFLITRDYFAARFRTMRNVPFFRPPPFFRPLFPPSPTVSQQRSARDNDFEMNGVLDFPLFPPTFRGPAHTLIIPR